MIAVVRCGSGRAHGAIIGLESRGADILRAASLHYPDANGLAATTVGAVGGETAANSGLTIVRQLENKPLVEAIFELRWTLEGNGSRDINEVVDTQAGVLPGLLYERLKAQYPVAERLPAATVPEELARFVVQHRFRAKPEGWPLFQVGPGVVTLNEVHDYSWDDFYRRIVELVRALVDGHPARDRMRFNAVSLRYINARKFDYASNDIFEFINQRFGVDLGVGERLQRPNEYDLRPFGLDSRLTFRCARPSGVAHLRFVRGEREGSDAIIWELSVQSLEEDTPQTESDLEDWATMAHDLIEYWFFSMLDEDLLAEFE